MLGKDHNEDPDRAERIRKLREEERRLAEQVRREREIVERMRAEKEALEKAIRKQPLMTSAKFSDFWTPSPPLVHIFTQPPLWASLTSSPPQRERH